MLAFDSFSFYIQPRKNCQVKLKNLTVKIEYFSKLIHFLAKDAKLL